MDDSALYTGVDGVTDGVFGNEVVEETTKKKLDEQRQLIAELTPKLQELIDMIDSEKSLVVEFITGYVDATKDPDELVRIEIKAAAQYRRYLDELKTKFILALNEVKGK